MKKSSRNAVASATAPSNDILTHSAPPARQSLYEHGRILRKKVKRKTHADWQKPAGRPDPVEMLIKSSEGRIPELVPIRYGRMMQSPFSFYRGTASIMACDLAKMPSIGVDIQICGDCHLLNFGGFATPERRQIFDINDFDETALGPWEWDLKRLATSFVIAAQHNGIDNDQARLAARNAAMAYREYMAELATMPALEAWYAALDFWELIEKTEDPELLQSRRKRLEKAIKKTSASTDYPKLIEAHNDAGERVLIKDNPPLIYHLEAQKHANFEKHIKKLLNGYRASLADHQQILLDRYSLCDLAVKVVGVGSVGTLCAIALLFATDDDPLILQIKEARPSVLEPYTQASIYPNRGQRVVIGQRIMQAASDIFLGWTGDEDGRHFYIRQLRDAKLKPLVETFNADHLAEYARACGKALARAHARSGKAALLSGYMGSSERFDEALADFALTYADQNEADYQLFLHAIRSGKLEATTE